MLRPLQRTLSPARVQGSATPLDAALPLGRLLSWTGRQKLAFAVRDRPQLVALVLRGSDAEARKTFADEVRSLRTIASWGLPALRIVADGTYKRPGDGPGPAIVVERFDVGSKDLRHKRPEWLRAHIPRLIDRDALAAFDRLEALMASGKVLVDCQFLLRERGHPRLVFTDSIARDASRGEIPPDWARYWNAVARDGIDELRALARLYGVR
jgi:hypothetical protein